MVQKNENERILQAADGNCSEVRAERHNVDPQAQAPHGITADSLRRVPG